MPIMLDNPKVHPVTNEQMPVAKVGKIYIDDDNETVKYGMNFGKLDGTKFLVLHDAGMYVITPADPAYTAVVSAAVHVIDGTEQTGDVITAFSLIAKAIYGHEQTTRPELFAGTILI